VLLLPSSTVGKFLSTVYRERRHKNIQLSITERVSNRVLILKSNNCKQTAEFGVLQQSLIVADGDDDDRLKTLSHTLIAFRVLRENCRTQLLFSWFYEDRVKTFTFRFIVTPQLII